MFIMSIGVTWLITSDGGNRPWVLWQSQFLKDGEGLFEPVLNVQQLYTNSMEN